MSNVERRAFLTDLKPRAVEILEAVAANAGRRVSAEELAADIKAARAEVKTDQENRLLENPEDETPVPEPLAEPFYDEEDLVILEEIKNGSRSED